MRTVIILAVIFAIFTLVVIFGCLKAASRLSRYEERQLYESEKSDE